MSEKRASLEVDVKTVDLATQTFTSTRIDFKKSSDRQWLGKHCFWAMHNNHSVITTPVTK